MTYAEQIQPVALLEEALMSPASLQEKLVLPEKEESSLTRLNVMAIAHAHAKNNRLIADLIQSTPAPQSGKKGMVGSSAPQESDPYNPFNGGGYVDQLAQAIENINNNPNDPTAIQNFINCLIGLNQNGEMNDPQVQAMLQQFNVMGNLKNMIFELIEATYFQQGGKGAAQAFMNQLQQILGGLQQNSYVQAMEGSLSLFNLNAFDQAHFVNGQYIWYIPNPDGSNTQVQLTWGQDNFAIMELIGNCQPAYGPGVTGPINPNPYVNGFDITSFMASYRENAINAFWSQTKNLGLLVMYFMMMYDSDYQNQQGGLANTTNLLSGITDNYATPLLQLAQNFGDISPTDTSAFIHLLMTSTVLINSESQTSSFASNWNTNVFQKIMQLDIPGGDTLGDVIGKYLAGTGPLSDVQNALQMIAGSTPPSPAYTGILSALQSGGGLVTGVSKTVSTELSTIGNLDNQVIKMGSSFATADGGGWVQLINQIINNFMSR